MFIIRVVLGGLGEAGGYRERAANSSESPKMTSKARLKVVQATSELILDIIYLLAHYLLLLLVYLLS